MLNSFPVRLLRHSLNWLTRLFVVASALGAVLIALSIIVLRYWLLPDIEQYHERITASVASAIGNPVTIGKIQSDWQGFLPRLRFTDVRILDGQRQPALVLQHIDASLSWLSLFTAELRLARLEIDRPELLVRRDTQGKIFVGNVVLAKQGHDNDLSDWLLHQSSMVVRNALIVWVDEQREAPPLVLQQVNIRVDSLFSQHRFAFQAVPPVELATPLDVRGEFYGDSFDQAGAWQGRLFSQIDYTDVTAWRPWLDLPEQFSRGRGALRCWLGIRAGKVNQITADLDLRDLSTRLAADLPELVLLELRGRAKWKETAGGFEVSTKRLAMREQNGLEFQPTNIYFRNTNASDELRASGEIRANLVQLESLVSLAKFLPMQPDQRANLDAYQPRGKVSGLDAQWQGSPGKQGINKLKGHFANLAINQVGKMPGFSGLTVDVDGNETTGRININSRQLTVDAPGMMREPLLFATVIGQAGWQHELGELSIDVDNIAVANDDLDGNLFGSYRARSGTLGVLDLTGRLTRGDISRAARYTPLVALNQEGSDWLNGALLAGHTENFRIRIKGNLSDFPPDGSKDVLFEIGGHARDAVLEFDKNWPRIKNISGEFLIRGNKLEVESPFATMLDSQLKNVMVTLPDMLSKDLSLEVKGEATGTSNAFLEFVQKSPVRGYIDGFTDGIRASGNGHLDLFARIPLQGDKPVEVSGTIKVRDNNISLGKGVPMLRNTRGALSFTESGMQAKDVSTEILGGAASIDVQTEEGGAVHATLKGRSNVDVLRKSEPHPLLDHLHGSAAWDADIRVVQKSARIVINSTLRGISSNLPLPFTKRADEVIALHLESNPLLVLPKRGVLGKDCVQPCPKLESSVVKGRDVITARLGEILNARLERSDQNGAMVIKRGTVNFGARQNFPATKNTRNSPRARDGVWLLGSLPEMSVQGWEDLAADAGKSAPTLPIAGINLQIDKLTGYGQVIDALHIDASRRGDGLAARLSSTTVNGELIWEPHGYEAGGMLRAHLSSLHWLHAPSDTTVAAHPVVAVQASPQSQLHPGDLPALELSIENLRVNSNQIGRFEVVGHPDGNDWRMRRLNITNPDGSLAGDGYWREAAGQMLTQLNLMLDISDAGKVLERSGYPNTVKGGNGRLEANLSWAEMPSEFSYATLNGTLKLDTGKGRFLKMNPGAGKLLSVLSLQDLPKHIALGFTDVFSEGFQFDNISGNASIKNGVIESQDFHIYGSSAKVTMTGHVDLNDETQDLVVRILPTLGDSMSLIGAFAISPAVGIGSLIVNKVLGDPLDKLASFEYNVSGTWSNPSVVKAGRGAVKQINPDE